ncbi:MAG: molecular chaperone DnaJ [Cognaticolwellia sp.]|jgi:molecular chaperone DnaJ
MSMDDRLYRALGVPRTAAAKEIKKAYRKLAKALHPDANPDNLKAHERFKEVSAAYEVLGNEEKRKSYDRFGSAATKAGFDSEQAKRWEQFQRGGGGMGMDDMLNQMFNGGGRAGRARQGGFGGGFGGPRQGHDIQAHVELDFRTAALGGEVTLSRGGNSPMRVRVPAGAKEGDTIRLRGKGQPSRSGGRPGDLLLQISVRPDEVFTRQGLDLEVEVPVSVGALLRGGKIEVPSLGGILRLSVPSGSDNGRVLRLKGKGIQRGSKTGNLLAKLMVKLPPLHADSIVALGPLLDLLEINEPDPGHSSEE